MIDEGSLIRRFKQLQGADSLANMFIKDVIAEIRKQPKGDRWIPCEEKLPVIGQCIIICTRNGDVGEGRLMVKGQSVIGAQELEWEHFRWISRIPYGEVLRWQPLPDAFEEEN